MVSYLTENHLDATYCEQESSTESIDHKGGHHYSPKVNNSEYNGRKQSGVVSETHRLKEVRGVKCDDVDARELLEEGDSNGHDQVRSIPSLKNGGEGLLLEIL